MNKKITIVQRNDLLESSYSLTIDEFRLLNLALSKIDSKNPQPPKPYTITPSEFKDTYNISPNHMHTQLKSAAQNLMKNPIKLYRVINGRLKGTEYPWFSMLEYDVEGDSSVKIVFSEFVRPYLYELAANFTQVKFHYIAALDSPFSARLYYWLSRERNFKKSKKGEVTVVDLNICWMKERAGLIGKHEDVRKFRVKVIEPAVQRINRNTDISVSFKPIKKGRTITGYSFAYIEDKEPALSDVTRPRLPRRPHIVKGSHEEGEWARSCINILLKYQKDLYVMQAKKLPKDDAKRLIRYAEVIGDRFLVDDTKKAYSL